MGVVVAVVAGLLLYASAPWWGSSDPPDRRTRLAAAVMTTTLGLSGWLLDPGWSLMNDAFVAITVVVGVIDIQERIIPNRWVLLMVAWALFHLGRHQDQWVAAMALALAVFLFFALIHLVTSGGLGLGDVKFAAALALGLGWPAGLLSTVVGLWAAGAVALVMTLVMRARRPRTMALGPFLAFGGLMGLLDLIR